jgi:peroxiredoxin
MSWRRRHSFSSRLKGKGEAVLGVGDKAPLFVARGSDGEVDLGALLAEKPVVLYFFPRALTPG